MNKPVAVLISDVHYSLNTLAVADAAFRAAIDTASELCVPLIDAGDLTNDKAIIRGEVANTLIKTMDYAARKLVNVFLLVGNHSLLNEKGEEHALNFLSPYAHIIDSVKSVRVDSRNTCINFVPYQNSNEKFIAAIKQHRGLIIGHQGFKGAAMGDYVIDSSSVDPKEVKNYRVISGHYHRHQTIGTVTYIGSPYTITFGEANDGPKGFLILNENGSFTREILNLRKHVIIDACLSGGGIAIDDSNINKDDLVWVKLTGSRSELDKVQRQDFNLPCGSNFKLDKIPNDSAEIAIKADTMSDSEIMDHIIDSSSEKAKVKADLKRLWRTLV